MPEAFMRAVLWHTWTYVSTYRYLYRLRDEAKSF